MSRGIIRAMNFAAAVVFILARPVGGADRGEYAADQYPDRKWGQAVNGQAVSIATAKTRYAPCEPIVLNIMFKNVGKEDVRYVVAFPLDTYQLSVSFTQDQTRWGHSVPGHHGVFDLLPNGNEVPRTLYGKYQTERLLGGSGSAVLKPGREKVLEVDLNRLFDMTLEGRYNVSVQRGPLWKGGTLHPDLKATSNTLEITIETKGLITRRRVGPEG